MQNKRKNMFGLNNYECQGCGGELFEKAVQLKRTASGVVPFEVLMCRSCSEVVPDHEIDFADHNPTF